METETELEIIEKAGHLFDKPGASEEIARITKEWFNKYLTRQIEFREDQKKLLWIKESQPLRSTQH